MKKIFRFTLLYLFSLITHNYFWSNLVFNQFIFTLVKVALVLTLFELILKPILRVLLLPITIITLGMFRLVTNTLGLYLATFLIANFSLQNIDRAPTVLYGLSIPAIHLVGFFSYLATSISLSFILNIYNLLLIKKQKK